MLHLIRRFNVDECAKYPYGYRDGPTEATRIKEIYSDDTEDDSIGTDMLDTAIEDDRTVSTADRRETGMSASKGPRSRPTTEVQSLGFEIRNHDAEPHTLAVIPDRVYGFDDPMQVTSSCDNHVAYLCYEDTRHSKVEAVQRDTSHPGAQQLYTEHDEVWIFANLRDQDEDDASTAMSYGGTSGIDVTDSFTHNSALTPTQPMPHSLFTALDHGTRYTALPRIRAVLHVFSCGIWSGLVSSPSMIAFPSRLHGDSVPSVDDQDYPTGSWRQGSCAATRSSIVSRGPPSHTKILRARRPEHHGHALLRNMPPWLPPAEDGDLLVMDAVLLHSRRLTFRYRHKRLAPTRMANGC